jgi:hypothetical protein
VGVCVEQHHLGYQSEYPATLPPTPPEEEIHVAWNPKSEMMLFDTHSHIMGPRAASRAGGPMRKPIRWTAECIRSTGRGGVVMLFDTHSHTGSMAMMDETPSVDNSSATGASDTLRMYG